MMVKNSLHDLHLEIYSRLQKWTGFCQSAAGLLPGSNQAKIRMPCLLQLDDNKLAANCQQA